MAYIYKTILRYCPRMIDLFEDVLFRNGEFTQVTSTSSGEVSLSELYKEGTELEMLKGHRQFAIIDLDDDGTAEVVLPLAVGDRQTPYGFEILHYHDNKIQGYTMMYPGRSLPGPFPRRSPASGPAGDP